MAGNHFSVKPQLLSGLDFDRIIYCNIGNPQQLQQKPITFFRQASSPLLIVRLRLPLCVHGMPSASSHQAAGARSGGLPLSHRSPCIPRHVSF
jgi:hypothetical protein